MPTIPPADCADERGLAQQAVLPSLMLYRDVLGGTARMRDQASRYLVQFPMEDDKRYERRVKQTVLHNATRMTRDALVGLAFLRDPDLATDLPPQIIRDCEDVDLRGTHLVVFLRQLFEEAFDGVAAVVEEMPRAGREIRTLEDERRAGMRSYSVLVTAENILRARSEVVEGLEVFTRFAYLETVVVDEGEFGERLERRVRDYKRTLAGNGSPQVMCYVYRQARDGGEWALCEPESGALSVGEIPVVLLQLGRVRGAAAADPPLLDLAYENIDHFQQRSEHRVSFQHARVPVLVLPGMPDSTTVVISPDSGITTPVPEAKPYWLEFEGKALRESREELRDGERRMAAHGASMLLRSDGAPVTATERKIEDTQSSSRLAAWVRALADAGERLLRLKAVWRGLIDQMPQQADDRRWLVVHRDFEQFEMDAQHITALDNAVANGHLTLETFLSALKAGVRPFALLDVEREAELLRDPAINP